MKWDRDMVKSFIKTWGTEHTLAMLADDIGKLQARVDSLCNGKNVVCDTCAIQGSCGRRLSGLRFGECNFYKREVEV